MTRRSAKKQIRFAEAWVLVLFWDDGEFGCLDARTDMACRLMNQFPDCVVGIYQPRQWRYLDKDFAARRNEFRMAA